MAIDNDINTVCIDEAAGRQIASLCGLSLTGSIGILIRAQHNGYDFSMQEAIEKMKNQGIWLSNRVINIALKKALKN